MNFIGYLIKKAIYILAKPLIILKTNIKKSKNLALFKINTLCFGLNLDWCSTLAVELRISFYNPHSADGKTKIS